MFDAGQVRPDNFYHSILTSLAYQFLPLNFNKFRLSIFTAQFQFYPVWPVNFYRSILTSLAFQFYRSILTSLVNQFLPLNFNFIQFGLSMLTAQF